VAETEGDRQTEKEKGGRRGAKGGRRELVGRGEPLLKGEEAAGQEEGAEDGFVVASQRGR
jgi:hypothetical protein